MSSSISMESCLLPSRDTGLPSASTRNLPKLQMCYVRDCDKQGVCMYKGSVCTRACAAPTHFHSTSFEPSLHGKTFFKNEKGSTAFLPLTSHFSNH